MALIEGIVVCLVPVRPDLESLFVYLPHINLQHCAGFLSVLLQICCDRLDEPLAVARGGHHDGEPERDVSGFILCVGSKRMPFEAVGKKQALHQDDLL